jgi:hypothetical protein
MFPSPSHKALRGRRQLAAGNFGIDSCESAVDFDIVASHRTVKVIYN